MKKILLLGSGELGKEFVIAAKRAGQYVIACDRYDNAPAMQVADEHEIFSMLNGDALEAVAYRTPFRLRKAWHSGGAKCTGGELHHEPQSYTRPRRKGVGTTHS
jgi:hypothetical protein